MKAKKKIKKYEEPWIRESVRSITKDSVDYDKKYMKIKVNSDDDLPLNKAIESPTVTTVVRAVFHENEKYYHEVFLDDCLYNI